LITDTVTAEDFATVDRWFSEEFWPLYPRKHERNAARIAARRALGVASQQKRKDVIESLTKQLLVLHPDNAPLALRWLEEERWLDEVINAEPIPQRPGLSEQLEALRVP
jgi:hypothetical protein